MFRKNRKVMNYFEGIARDKYTNIKKHFESDAILEIMQMPTIPSNLNDTIDQYIGLIHIAISVGSIEKINRLTGTLKNAGYTRDGYYVLCNEVSRMVDFANAAFHWIAMGFAVAIILANRSSKEKMQDNKEQ